MLALQPRDAAHHLVHIGHVVGHVVEAGRPGEEGNAVVRFVAAQEAHEIAQPVAQLEAQHIDEERQLFMVAGRMHHDVADPLGDRLTHRKCARAVPRATPAEIS